ncbi:hypothetical protein FBU31_006189, partial [Coemansia sp. 'formosensis']
MPDDDNDNDSLSLLQTPERQLLQSSLANTELRTDSEYECAPLLPPSDVAPFASAIEHSQTSYTPVEFSNGITANITRCVTPILGACLAASCLAIGVYILYISCHIPSIILAARGSEPELVSASLIDMSDESIVFSACMRFPQWNSRPALVPYANATVFHNGEAVGWLRVNDLVVANSQTNLSIHEVFHISDQHALERLISDVALSRRVVVSIRAIVDLSGFGRYLPVVSVRHSLDVALPPQPAIQLVAVDDLKGPAVDATEGGVSAHATILATLPPGFAANIDALRFGVDYNGVCIASADIGPVSVAATGTAAIPVSVNIKPIAGRQHENALADMIRTVAAGSATKLSIAGAPSTDYQTAPTWLRRALHNVVVPVSASIPQLPLEQLPSLGAL